MKLRYYLRGLAIGILITTIILTIANRDNKPLTDAEIKNRALQLGMVDESSKKLSDLPEPTKPDAEQKPEITQPGTEPEPETPQTGTDQEPETPQTETDQEPETPQAETDQELETPQTETQQEPESETQQEPTAEPESAGDATQETGNASETETMTADATEPVTIQINRGASSYSVSKSLAAAGLVEDADSYDAYLCRNGYAGRIHIGSYQIPPGSSEEEIARIITN